MLGDHNPAVEVDGEAVGVGEVIQHHVDGAVGLHPEELTGVVVIDDQVAGGQKAQACSELDVRDPDLG